MQKNILSMSTSTTDAALAAALQEEEDEEEQQHQQLQAMNIEDRHESEPRSRGHSDDSEKNVHAQRIWVAILATVDLVGIGALFLQLSPPGFPLSTSQLAARLSPVALGASTFYLVPAAASPRAALGLLRLLLAAPPVSLLPSLRDQQARGHERPHASAGRHDCSHGVHLVQPLGVGISNTARPRSTLQRRRAPRAEAPSASHSWRRRSRERR